MDSLEQKSVLVKIGHFSFYSIRIRLTSRLDSFNGEQITSFFHMNGGGSKSRRDFADQRLAVESNLLAK